ncbi:MAG TPA: DNA polymerase I [Candidatus Sabulitectum sp.]|nr:DNA polymerase I [Candidatus Sabulitectum sp.]
MRKLILFDTLGILYRGHYAMIKRPLKGADGTVTSGLSHLLSELTRVMEENPGALVAAVGDAPGPTFRSEIYPEYKANRPETPEDLRTQTELARKIIPLMGIPFIEEKGYEADDLIAGLARESSDPVLVVSPDKDLLQLVSSRISVLRPGRYGGSSTLVEEGGVGAIMGVPAGKVADLLALMGDSSDNIPGAKGIGAKGAASLLQRYDSIEDIYADIDSVTPDSLRRKLADSEDAVRLSLSLTRLDRPLPRGVSAGNISMGTPREEELLPLLQRLSLSRTAEFAGMNIVPSAGHPEYDCAVTIASGPGDISLPGEGPIAIDTETTSRDPSQAELIGFSVSAEPDSAVYVDYRGTSRKKDFLEVLEDQAAARGYIAQNAKYDARVLMNCGVHLPGPSGDPYLADYLLRPDSREHSLKKLVPLWLGRTIPTFAEITGGDSSLQKVAMEEIASYCCTDSSSTMALCRRLHEELEKDQGLNRVYRTVELPLSAVLAAMERRGIGLDREALRQEGDAISARLFALMEKAGEQTGRSVNLASPQQVATVLFDTLGLDPVRKTSGGARSTGMTVLEALRGKHPFVETLIEFRELSKLQNTYIEKLPGFVNPRTGLIHTSFNQAVTATGRLSSSNPNMQNIPIRTERGRAVRRCFVPPEKDHVFVTADYSQIELRILAHLAGDGILRRAYLEDADIHSRTAEAIFGDASPEHRRKAKEVNFSIIYGISAYGLSQRLSIPRGEASEIISKYYETYPEVRRFYRETVALAEEQGEVRTILGRKRPFQELAGARGNSRKQMERAAVNTRVQGSAADMIKLAMIKVADKLNRELPGASLVLQVHDELVVTCPGELAGDASRILKGEMGSALELDVPLTVETGTGENWLAAGH